jgi:signal transduction histidine kinase
MQASVEVTPSAFGAAKPAPGIRGFFPRKISQIGLTVVCLVLIAVLGYIDYLTGYEQSFLLFYLLPIALGAWFGTLILGLIFSILSVLAWILSDLAAGVPTVGFWNLGMALASYCVFTIILSKLRTLLDQLDQRVRERTAALEREIVERKRLDQEIAQVADRERRRLGQDLHDNLSQHLTGTALAAQVLKEKLIARSAPEVPDAEKVVRYMEEGIDLTRNLARGFFSPELEADGLMVALQGLAENIAERFGVNCVLDGEEWVRVHDSTVATNLYRIAQEAVANSVKHAAAKRIEIRLAMERTELTLTIFDDGVGFPDKVPQPQGLGLRLMSHGAALIGAGLEVRRGRPRGTIVTCKLNIPSENQ